MDDPFHETGLPRGPLIAAALLVAATIVAVAAVRVTGVGAYHEPDAAAVAVAEFHFVDRADGSIEVLDARSGALVQRVEPGTNGFLRGTLRGLARERRRQEQGPEAPFRLIGRADGRLTLEDPVTGRRVDLESFGPTNAAAFARLMGAAPPAVVSPSVPARPAG